MSVKPLMHWAIYKNVTLRITRRQPEEVEGFLNTPEGRVPFRYRIQERRIFLPDQVIAINPWGWERSQDAREPDEGDEEGDGGDNGEDNGEDTTPDEETHHDPS